MKNSLVIWHEVSRRDVSHIVTATNSTVKTTLHYK
jgi:hypothetical protein